MATMTVLNSVGATETVEKPLTPGRAAATASRPVALSNEDAAAVTAMNAILGVSGDAASATTTIKAALRLIAATGIPTTSLPVQFGAGASTGTTQRVTIDTGQLGSLVSGSVPVVSGGFEYETVAASQTDQSLGATGATGDYIEGLLCVVATAATSQVQIKDGAGTAIIVLPNAVGAGVGSYYVPLGLVSVAGAWKVTTAAGVSVIATGNFT